MRYVKMLGLSAVAAMALMGFVPAGTASATKLCETTPTVGQPCPAGWSWAVGAVAEFSKTPNTTIQFEITEGGAGTTCAKASTKGPLTNAGSSTTTVVGAVSQANLKFEECTGVVNVLTGGELEFHSIAGTHNGTVTAKGVLLTVTFGFHCAYGASTGIDFGTFTPGAVGTDGTLVVNAIISRISGHNGTNFSIFCPATTRWTASYTQTTNTDAFITVS